MRRTEHLGARALTLVGLAATLVYLVWRTTSTLDGTVPWLSLPVLAVEVVGFLAATVLAWALWPSPADHPTTDELHVTGIDALDPFGDDEDHDVDAVVRVDLHPASEVRATLLALRGVGRVGRAVVVDLSARPEVAALANEFGAGYAASDAADRNGLRVMPAIVHSDRFLLLDAGDVPTVDIVERLDPVMADEHVAVVQGLGVSLAEDSAEHGPSGHHELRFERASLNPALGVRGNAIWSGTGSLVRTSALRDLQPGNEPVLEAQWLAGTALLAAGWRLLAPGDVPVLAHRTVLDEGAASQDHLLRARAARRIVFGRGGALRSSTLTPRQRLSLVAWAVRPLSGLRRVAFLVLLGAALLFGSVPFHATVPALLAIWLPAFAATSLGLGLLSAGTLQPGDRSRWSLRTMGAACRSLRSPRGPRATTRELPDAPQGLGLLIALVALSSILVLRGVSDRLTHWLGTMPQGSLMALLLVTLWALGLSLDLLRVLARRTQLRSTTRVVSSLPALLGDRSVHVVDVTALGAGLISQTGADVDEQLLLDTVVPTSSGVTTVRVLCVVRNVSLLTTGDYRIGIEFGDLDEATANALAEFCTIEPVWAQLGSVAAARRGGRMMAVDAPDLEHDGASARGAVRIVSLLALVGVVASALPTTADASPSLHHPLRGAIVAVAAPVGGDTTTADTTLPDTTVLDTTVPDTAVETTLESNLFPSTTVADTATGAALPVPGALVVAVCALEPGADGAWGTNDDDYSAPVSTITDADGGYTLDLVGKACWASVSPPEQFEEATTTSGQPQIVDLGGSIAAIDPVVLRRIEVAELAPAAGLPRGSIGDAVWRDDDGDGFQDPQEPGVIGVSLALLDAAGHRLESTHSDASGEFHFNGVAPGSYRISAANVPAGLMLTTALAGADSSADSDTDPVTGRTGVVVLAAGERAADLDVGLVPVTAATAAAAVSPAAQVLPAPAAAQVASGSHPGSTLWVVVVAFAALLALSIVLGGVRPRSRRVG